MIHKINDLHIPYSNGLQMATIRHKFSDPLPRSTGNRTEGIQLTNESQAAKKTNISCMSFLIFSFLFFLCACTSKSSNEMEEMSRDVLKAHQGVEIEVKPLPKN